MASSSRIANKLPLEMLYHWERQCPDRTYLRQTINREYVDFTWGEVADEARRMVTALRHLGLVAGDKVALLSKNCAQWFIADLAMQMGQYVSVPIYPTANVDTIEYVLRHSEAKAIFVGKLDDWKSQEAGVPADLLRIAFPYDTMPASHQWDDLLEAHEPIPDSPVQAPDSLLSLVYTSGSTGKPKGAMLSVERYAWSCEKLVETVSLSQADRGFSYLPLAHITERVYIYGGSLYGGATIAFPESLDTFIEDVKRCRPTVFISVPRLWAMFRIKIHEKLPQNKLELLLKIPLISGLIKRKLQKGLGLDQARVLGCGSAPVSPALLEWYLSIGLKVTEAWGMTENHAYSTINYPFRADKIGTVGKAGIGVTIKISDEGEILCRCEGMMLGYYKDPEHSAEAIDAEGWLHTGDMGKLDKEGYLTITGRMKDVFKTAKGKYVAPVPIEGLLGQEPIIEQLCVIGYGMPQPIALVQLAESAMKGNREEVNARLEAARVRVNDQLESHAKIRGILVVKTPWNIENGVLTPTMKIKRHLLEQKYAQVGDRWPSSQVVVWEE
ncbi:AMP-binding protein [Aeromonas veronii]|uniref:AMP-dependent synthetase n=2 Tax=Aeromonas veronii TaxID=654 RepID=A0A142E2E1_AERVE|nr:MULTISPECIES: AMP-binding protein [Aeromonas]AEB49664.1 AMP-dependent synthetase and ligase [Aeromonas veronii B565]AMQ42329.1 AMP-dependent synthetase [Aeromonas veronii]ANB51233.1 AMP-dependent synthetase [Aeromonas veronii]KZW96933.1 AMP-dependent synthetase [Aeromonas veronii]MBS4693005.1 AMP-binding protein [Aeromonas veronii bv. veronii]